MDFSEKIQTAIRSLINIRRMGLYQLQYCAIRARPCTLVEG